MAPQKKYHKKFFEPRVQHTAVDLPTLQFQRETAITRLPYANNISLNTIPMTGLYFTSKMDKAFCHH